MANDRGDKLVATKRLDYSSTNVLNSAFVELFSAATLANNTITAIEIWDTSGEDFLMAQGNSITVNNDWFRYGPGGLDRQNVYLGRGKGIHIKSAATATVSSGIVTINLWGG